jgi:hypothetical protein
MLLLIYFSGGVLVHIEPAVPEWRFLTEFMLGPLDAFWGKTYPNGLTSWEDRRQEVNNGCVNPPLRA